MKTILITDEQIKALALANGFKVKEQPDGSTDLNPYVYDFARKLIAVENSLHAAQEDLAALDRCG